MRHYKFLLLAIAFLLVVDHSSAISSSEFVIDSNSEWDQGTYNDINQISGSVYLGLDGTNGDNDIFFVHSGTLKFYDSGTGEIYPVSNISPLGSDKDSYDTLGDPADIDNDGTPEVPYIKDGTQDLYYYDIDQESKVDTSVDTNSFKTLGGSSDVDSDGDVEIIFLNSNNYVTMYDHASGTTTSTGTGFSDSDDNLGYPYDADSDGTTEVPGIGKDFGNINLYNFTESHSVNEFNDAKDKASFPYGLGGWYDITADADNKELFFGDNDGDISYIEINYQPIAGDDAVVELLVSNALPGEVGDLDGDGNDDLAIIDLSTSPNSLSFYDFGLSSKQDTLHSGIDQLGGIGDVGFTKSGKYVSKTFDAGSKYNWTNITLGGLDRPGSSSVNFTVETSTDSFSTVQNSKTFIDNDLIDGNSDYYLNLDEGTQYARVTIWFEKGSSPDLDNFTLRGKEFNKAPSVDRQKLIWSGIAESDTRELFYGISDPNGNEISSHNNPPSGATSAFTNSTYNITGFSSDFDYIPTITDFKGATGTGKETNFSLSKQVYVEHTSGTFNESRQLVNTTAKIDVRSDPLNLSISFKDPSVLIEEVVDGDTSFTDATGTKVVDSQYYVDHIETQTFSEEKDESRESTIDTQHLVKQKQVHNNWSTSYSSLKVDAVSSITGSCTNCNQRTISIPGNSKKNVSFNSSGDFISSEKEFDFTPNPDIVTLDVDYKGRRNFQMQENQGFSWNGINITGNVTKPGGCSQSNNSEVNVPASSFQNYTVQFSCDPGSIGNPTQEVISIDNGDRIWINASDMNIRTNQTENSVIHINTSKDQWQDNGVYDGGSLEAFVEGVSSSGNTALNISDTGTYFQIKVGTNFQSSSLHTTDTDWSITYTATSDSGGGGTGGGGSGGGSGVGGTIIEGGDDDGTTFTFSNPIYSLQRGGQQTKTFFVTHTGDGTADVQVTVPPADQQPACQVFSLQTRHPPENDTVQYGGTGVYTMQPGSQGLVGKYTRPVGIKVDLPSSQGNLDKLMSDGTISCTFTTSTDTGTAGEFTARVRIIENPIAKFFATLFNQVLSWLGSLF